VELFRPYGPVRQCRIFQVLNRSNCGSALVRMNNLASARKAIQVILDFCLSQKHATMNIKCADRQQEDGGALLGCFLNRGYGRTGIEVFTRKNVQIKARFQCNLGRS